MSVALLDFSFFCLLFNVTRLSGEKSESSTHAFCTREVSRFCQQSCVLLSNRERMNNDHAAHRSRMERFDIVKPNVALKCVPNFGKTPFPSRDPSSRPSRGAVRVTLQGGLEGSPLKSHPSEAFKGDLLPPSLPFLPLPPTPPLQGTLQGWLQG